MEEGPSQSSVTVLPRVLFSASVLAFEKNGGDCVLPTPVISHDIKRRAVVPINDGDDALPCAWVVVGVKVEQMVCITSVQLIAVQVTGHSNSDVMPTPLKIKGQRVGLVLIGSKARANPIVNPLRHHELTTVKHTYAW